jgi:hypothetical protein
MDALLPSKITRAQVLSRQEAAAAELNAAIRSLFLHEDMVAAHLLGWAALDIVSDVGKARGVKTFRSSLASKMSPSMLSAWKKAERDHYNFLKHADRDPLRRVKLHPEMTLFALYMAVRDYQAVFNASTYTMGVFLAWYLNYEPRFALALGARDLVNDLFCDRCNSWEKAKTFLASLAASGDAVVT